MSIKKLNLYLKDVFKTFIKSFKLLKSKFLVTYLFDILFYLLFTAGLALAARFSRHVFADYSMLNIYGPTAAVQGALQKLIVSIGLVSVAYFAVFVGLYSILKGLIWKYISKNSSASFLSKYFHFCIVWLAFFVIALTALLFSVKSEAMPYVIYFFMFLWIHSMNVSGAFFGRHARVRKTLAAIFTKGFGKIHKFILPYLLASAVFFVFVQLWRFIPQAIQINPTYAVLVYVLLIIAPFFAWFRIFMFEVFEKV